MDPETGTARPAAPPVPVEVEVVEEEVPEPEVEAEAELERVPVKVVVSAPDKADEVVETNPVVGAGVVVPVDAGEVRLEVSVYTDVINDILCWRYDKCVWM